VSDEAVDAARALEAGVRIIARMIVKAITAELREQERFFGDAGSGLKAPVSSVGSGVNRPGESLVYSVPEAMKLPGISRATAYNLIQTGQIPCLRFGKRILIPKIALTKLTEEAVSIKPGNA